MRPTIRCLLLSAVALPGPALASSLLDRAGIEFGWHAVQARSRIDVAVEPLGRGETLALEDDLGLARSAAMPGLRLDLALGERRQLCFEWLSVARDAAASLSRSVAFDGLQFPVDARLAARMDYRQGSLAYRAWLGDERSLVGWGVGLALYRLDSGLDGEATVAGERFHYRREDRDAALAPLVWLGWRQAVGSRVRLYADLGGIGKPRGRLNGHIGHGQAGAEYLLGKRASLALEYRVTSIRLQRRDDLYRAGFDLRMAGPGLLLRLRG